MHERTGPFAGRYGLAADTVTPLRESFADWLSADVRWWLERTRGRSARTIDADVAWLNRRVSHGDLRRTQPALGPALGRSADCCAPATESSSRKVVRPKSSSASRSRKEGLARKVSSRSRWVTRGSRARSSS